MTGDSAWHQPGKSTFTSGGSACEVEAPVPGRNAQTFPDVASLIRATHLSQPEKRIDMEPIKGVKP
jgi:hypothetical protein